MGTPICRVLSWEEEPWFIRGSPGKEYVTVIVGPKVWHAGTVQARLHQSSVPSGIMVVDWRSKVCQIRSHAKLICTSVEPTLQQSLALKK
jgi:hypothetical protein